MAHGIEAELFKAFEDSGKRIHKGGRFRNLPSEGSNQRKETPVYTTKPPCAHCAGNHGAWSCRR